MLAGQDGLESRSVGKRERMDSVYQHFLLNCVPVPGILSLLSLCSSKLTVHESSRHESHHLYSIGTPLAAAAIRQQKGGWTLS